MKRALIPEEQTDLNPTHLNESSTSLDSDHLLSSSAKEQTVKLPRLKSQTLSRNRTVNFIILILGNLAIILLLLFLYFSL